MNCGFLTHGGSQRSPRTGLMRRTFEALEITTYKTKTVFHVERPQPCSHSPPTRREAPGPVTHRVGFPRHHIPYTSSLLIHSSTFLRIVPSNRIRKNRAATGLCAAASARVTEPQSSPSIQGHDIPAWSGSEVTQQVGAGAALSITARAQQYLPNQADVMGLQARPGAKPPSWGPNRQMREGLAFVSLKGLGTGTRLGRASAGVGPFSIWSWRTGFPSPRKEGSWPSSFSSM